MKALQRILAQPRLILAAVAIFSLFGLFSWFQMPRQEDPRLTRRFAIVIVPFPGVMAANIERLVVRPLEDELASVEDIRRLLVTSRNGVALASIELRPEVYATDQSWDRIRRALERAKRRFPAGAGEPTLHDDITDIQSVVLAISGERDLRELSRIARELKDEFRTVPQVSRVELIADPEQQVTITLTDLAKRRYGLDARQVIAQLQSRNTVVPGGSFRLGDRDAILNVRAEFQSLAELEQTPILLESGVALPLSAIAQVQHEIRRPAEVRMRFQGKPAIGIGLVAREPANIVQFGEAIRAKVRVIAPKLAGVTLNEVSYQPQRVQERIGELQLSLLLGMAIVAGLLFLTMGRRLGLLVSAVIPVVALTSLAIYALGGGVLHQVSIAAIVVALGMLVDNAIVVGEDMQRLIDDGQTPGEAAQLSVRGLAFPLATATGTTLAAFVPMLLAPGNTGDFTRSLPVVIILTLSMSYLFAVLVTPAMASFMLKPRSKQAIKSLRLTALVDLLGRWSVTRSTRVLALGTALVVIAGALVPFLQQRFFPSSDRNQLIVDLRAAEGSDLSAVDEAALTIEAGLRGRSEVLQVASFVGQSAPRFYYNVMPEPSAPHLAQLVVTTKTVDDVDTLIAWLDHLARKEVPHVTLVARKLEQGPPVNAPIEVRAYSSDLAQLQLAAEAVVAELRQVPGAIAVRHSLSSGTPLIEIAVDDVAAGRRRLSRVDVALSLLGRSRGLPAGDYRGAGTSIPIVLSSASSAASDQATLDALDVGRPGASPVPIDQVSVMRPTFQPAAIHRRNSQRVVVVSAQLAPGVTYDNVLRVLRPRLASIGAARGIEFEIGGEAEASDEANLALVKVMPVGLGLLIFFLLLEFSSFRKVAIIMVTVPLASAGVIPGLLLSGQPFGFMSMLGAIALAGIVVNNAIILLDVIDHQRRKGRSVEAAVRSAVGLRTRPILLTSATTVVGLLPLACSSSTLWPPLAWAMISGLSVSTALSLLVIPALYYLIFRNQDQRRNEPAPVAQRNTVIATTAGVQG
jgi:multidrug efflux pump subunit AcrB